MDFDFEDDIFQSKQKSNINNALNDNYKAKLVQPKSFLDEPTDNLELEDSINLRKLKADYYYYLSDYNKALDIYKSCLDSTLKSSTLVNTLFQRELEESIANIYSNFGLNEDAIKICDKLEKIAENYNNYSAALNLRLKILSNNKTNLDYDELIITHLRLLIIHPYCIQLWIKLANIFDLFSIKSGDDLDYKQYFQICYYYVNELNKHGYINRSEVMNKQKNSYLNWIENNKNKVNVQNEVIEQEANKKLETMDRLNDNERITKSREFINKNDLFNLWFRELYNLIKQ